MKKTKPTMLWIGHIDLGDFLLLTVVRRKPKNMKEHMAKMKRAVQSAMAVKPMPTAAKKKKGKN